MFSIIKKVREQIENLKSIGLFLLNGQTFELKSLIPFLLFSFERRWHKDMNKRGKYIFEVEKTTGSWLKSFGGLRTWIIKETWSKVENLHLSSSFDF